ncbi:ABC transporter ATP-binding protein [Azospirillum picis]|uniref:Branched-chain amino acid transport system ATP-binding protein n=1 Tax=Azospirillum picis TaxID=488438 RepID=A0ABU0MMT4_9PROT|nr:ABC transporter ATP-binding protein [Azospirillum picis]MBP2300680.1 branched-chain amino acid transport system ATP-binding protein [Azospirillum picis]MDQ0534649.1 branched-chain amino acid transport system ATP-binding protein [Azospirillum picis]
MLRIDGLSAGYGRLEVLHAVSFTVERDLPTVMLGANGAGKTTLCRVISGLIPARAGGIVLDGADITRLSPAERVRAGIALVPEGRQVFPDMTVRENLRLGAYVHGEPGRTGFDAVFAMFPILAQRQNQRAGLLSGGEQQMLALARALMSRPRLLLLDEPSQGLAPKAVALIAETVNRIAATGVGVLLVEQNLILAQAIARHAVVLETGTCVADGPAGDLLAGGAVADSYLGKTRRHRHVV